MNENAYVKAIVKAISNGFRCVIVRGAAGTGKTTLVKDLIPALQTIGLSPALMTPTGRAALVLKDRTGYGAGTIHSAIYNVNDEPIVNETGDALKWIFPLKIESDVEDMAFIVDEASMVGLARHENERELLQFGSGSLLRDLIQYAGVRIEGTSNVLVFVGDPFQLPPVGENCSTPPALNENKLSELIGHPVYVVELTQVYRQQAGSGILAEATKMRTSMTRHDFNYFKCNAHEDLIIESEANFLEAFDPHHDLDDKIIVSHTNLQVDDYNHIVRQRLDFRSPYPEKGERLLSIRNTHFMLPSGAQASFLNGDFLRVECASDKTFSLDGYYKPKGCTETFRFTYTWRKMKLCWVYEKYRHLEDELWVNVSPIASKEWNEHPEYASVGLYNGVKAHIEKRLREGGCRASHDLVKQKLKESVLLHAPIVKFGYAVTGHKSQGGEWKYVWVDYIFGPNPMSEYFFRWAYTATTRAKVCLHALCPPKIDQLSNVLGRRTEKTSSNDRSGMVKGTLSELLGSLKMRVSSIVSLSWCYRVLLVKDGAVELPVGYVDFRYRKNNRVSCVDVRVAEVDLPRSTLQTFVDRDVRSVLGLEGADGSLSGGERNSPLSLDGLPKAQGEVVRRLKDAIKGTGVALLSAEAMSPYQVRLTFESDRGGGSLDLYFKGNGRLSYCDRATLCAADMDVVRNALS